MYALAINGSPRKGGNTAILLENVMKPLQEAGWETEIVQVGNKKIQGCRACNACAQKQDKRCVFNDDVFNEVFEKMVRADALVLGSPCYFADMTAELKAVIDRSGYVALANGGLFTGKIGAAVVAVRRGGAIHVFDSINHMFLMSKMIVPGSTYWNMGYGREKEEVRGDAEALNNMQDLGKRIAWLGKATAQCTEPFPA